MANLARGDELVTPCRLLAEGALSTMQSQSSPLLARRGSFSLSFHAQENAISMLIQIGNHSF